ncbi:hypothetical protein KW784_01785 [Candidatus Parcubacteria bacterium]|nr:hypothetical protein [Candidatus Parcubacteria bacterium]
MSSQKRNLVSSALVLAVLFLPYWAYVPPIALAALLLPFYWEAVVLGFLIDTLYGQQGSFPAALAAAAFVALLMPVRKRLRWTS